MMPRKTFLIGFIMTSYNYDVKLGYVTVGNDTEVQSLVSHFFAGNKKKQFRLIYTWHVVILNYTLMEATGESSGTSEQGNGTGRTLKGGGDAANDGSETPFRLHWDSYADGGYHRSHRQNNMDEFLWMGHLPTNNLEPSADFSLSPDFSHCLTTQCSERPTSVSHSDCECPSNNNEFETTFVNKDNDDFKSLVSTEYFSIQEDENSCLKSEQKHVELQFPKICVKLDLDITISELHPEYRSGRNELMYSANVGITSEKDKMDRKNRRCEMWLNDHYLDRNQPRYTSSGMDLTSYGPLFSDAGDSVKLKSSSDSKLSSTNSKHGVSNLDSIRDKCDVSNSVDRDYRLLSLSDEEISYSHSEKWSDSSSDRQKLTNNKNIRYKPSNAIAETADQNPLTAPKEEDQLTQFLTDFENFACFSDPIKRGAFDTEKFYQNNVSDTDFITTVDNSNINEELMTDCMHDLKPVDQSSSDEKVSESKPTSLNNNDNVFPALINLPTPPSDCSTSMEDVEELFYSSSSNASCDERNFEVRPSWLTIYKSSTTFKPYPHQYEDGFSDTTSVSTDPAFGDYSSIIKRKAEDKHFREDSISDTQDLKLVDQRGSYNIVLEDERNTVIFNNDGDLIADVSHLSSPPSSCSTLVEGSREISNTSTGNTSSDEWSCEGRPSWLTIYKSNTAFNPEENQLVESHSRMPPVTQVKTLQNSFSGFSASTEDFGSNISSKKSVSNELPSYLTIHDDIETFDPSETKCENSIGQSTAQHQQSFISGETDGNDTWVTGRPNLVVGSNSVESRDKNKFCNSAFDQILVETLVESNLPAGTVSNEVSTHEEITSLNVQCEDSEDNLFVPPFNADEIGHSPSKESITLDDRTTVSVMNAKKSGLPLNVSIKDSNCKDSRNSHDAEKANNSHFADPDYCQSQPLHVYGSNEISFNFEEAFGGRDHQNICDDTFGVKFDSMISKNCPEDFAELCQPHVSRKQEEFKESQTSTKSLCKIEKTDTSSISSSSASTVEDFCSKLNVMCSGISHEDDIVSSDKSHKNKVFTQEPHTELFADSQVSLDERLVAEEELIPPPLPRGKKLSTIEIPLHIPDESKSDFISKFQSYIEDMDTKLYENELFPLVEENDDERVLMLPAKHENSEFLGFILQPAEDKRTHKIKNKLSFFNNLADDLAKLLVKEVINNVLEKSIDSEVTLSYNGRKGTQNLRASLQEEVTENSSQSDNNKCTNEITTGRDPTKVVSWPYFDDIARLQFFDTIGVARENAVIESMFNNYVSSNLLKPMQAFLLELQNWERTHDFMRYTVNFMNHDRRKSSSSVRDTDDNTTDEEDSENSNFRFNFTESTMKNAETVKEQPKIIEPLRNSCHPHQTQKNVDSSDDECDISAYERAAIEKDVLEKYAHLQVMETIKIVENKLQTHNHTRPQWIVHNCQNELEQETDCLVQKAVDNAKEIFLSRLASNTESSGLGQHHDTLSMDSASQISASCSFTTVLAAGYTSRAIRQGMDELRLNACIEWHEKQMQLMDSLKYLLVDGTHETEPEIDKREKYKSKMKELQMQRMRQCSPLATKSCYKNTGKHENMRYLEEGVKHRETLRTLKNMMDTDLMLSRTEVARRISQITIQTSPEIKFSPEIVLRPFCHRFFKSSTNTEENATGSEDNASQVSQESGEEALETCVRSNEKYNSNSEFEDEMDNTQTEIPPNMDILEDIHTLINDIGEIVGKTDSDMNEDFTSKSQQNQSRPEKEKSKPEKYVEPNTMQQKHANTESKVFDNGDSQRDARSLRSDDDNKSVQDTSFPADDSISEKIKQVKEKDKSKFIESKSFVNTDCSTQLLEPECFVSKEPPKNNLLESEEVPVSKKVEFLRDEALKQTSKHLAQNIIKVSEVDISQEYLREEYKRLAQNHLGVELPGEATEPPWRDEESTPLIKPHCSMCKLRKKYRSPRNENNVQTSENTRKKRKDSRRKTDSSFDIKHKLFRKKENESQKTEKNTITKLEDDSDFDWTHKVSCALCKTKGKAYPLPQ